MCASTRRLSSRSAPRLIERGCRKACNYEAAIATIEWQIIRRAAALNAEIEFSSASSIAESFGTQAPQDRAGAVAAHHRATWQCRVRCRTDPSRIAARSRGPPRPSDRRPIGRDTRSGAPSQQTAQCLERMLGFVAQHPGNSIETRSANHLRGRSGAQRAARQADARQAGVSVAIDLRPADAPSRAPPSVRVSSRLARVAASISSVSPRTSRLA